MTETQKTLNLLEDAEYVVKGLLELEKDELERGLQDYLALKNKMDHLLLKTSKYRKFIAIKDSSKQIYGPKMLEKMKNMCQRFEELDQSFEEQLTPIFESIEAEYRRKLLEMDQEERRRKEEELQRRVQEGLQETYLEEKRRLEISKERQIEEARRKAELDRLTQEEEEMVRKKAQKVEEIVAFIENLENQDFVDSIAGQNFWPGSRQIKEYSGLKKVWTGIKLLLKADELELRDFYICIGLISDLLGSILRDPSDIKYRLLRLNNDNFFNSFGKNKGSFSIFSGIGFSIIEERERKEYFEILSSEKDLGLSASRLNSTDIYLVLREPDPIDQFEAWKSWLDKVEVINDILKQIINFKHDRGMSKEELLKLAETVVFEYGRKSELV
ncbi:putative RPC10 subunit of RNA polymerases I, II, and III [Cryptosporidium felis]|nr:putative RPC10 subunit of RNA polymerases I, II, and III [Cryptosporidium felis]